jgi:hypothetical protein
MRLPISHEQDVSRGSTRKCLEELAKMGIAFNLLFSLNIAQAKRAPCELVGISLGEHDQTWILIRVSPASL